MKEEEQVFIADKQRDDLDDRHPYTPKWKCLKSTPQRELNKPTNIEVYIVKTLCNVSSIHSEWKALLMHSSKIKSIAICLIPIISNSIWMVYFNDRGRVHVAISCVKVKPRFWNLDRSRFYTTCLNRNTAIGKLANWSKIKTNLW